MENTGQEEDLPETIGSIAPFVLGCLEQRSFFSELEKRVWPEGPDGRRDCDHSLDHTLSILRTYDWQEEDCTEVLLVMQSRGGCCDCEIMLNVAPDCQARERHWKRKAARLEKKNR
jgi:hypothetical protein